MSDITWIALIIIVYMLVIRPLMQGMMNRTADHTGKQKTEIRKTTTHTEMKKDASEEYVDYEELK